MTNFYTHKLGKGQLAGLARTRYINAGLSFDSSILLSGRFKTQAKPELNGKSLYLPVEE